MRKSRKNSSNEKKKTQPEKEKEGMRLFRKEGWLGQFKSRSRRNINEFDGYRKFKERNEEALLSIEGEESKKKEFDDFYEN